MKLTEENGLNLHIDKGWEGNKIIEAQIRGWILQRPHFKKDDNKWLTRPVHSQICDKLEKMSTFLLSLHSALMWQPVLIPPQHKPLSAICPMHPTRIVKVPHVSCCDTHGLSYFKSRHIVMCSVKLRLQF